MSRRLITTSQFRCSSSTNNSPPILTPIIQRHGPSDGVITLNVGGKNFQTLRSTIAQNDVLMDHVVRAEVNLEICKTTTSEGGGGGAIFIDRDPKHFGMILSYLRNKADGVYRHPSVAAAAQRQLMKFGSGGSGSNSNVNNNNYQAAAATQRITKTISTASMIRLPKDSKTLSEMYFESIHYNIPELSDRICSQQTLTRIFDLFGSTNPFNMATSAMAMGKRALVLIGGVGGWVYAQAMAVPQQVKITTNGLSTALQQSDYCEECGGKEDRLVKDATGFWKKQAKYWEMIADKWNGSQEGK